MPWVLLNASYSILVLTIEIGTGLLLGLSLVGVNLSKAIGRVLFIGLLCGFLVFIVQTATDRHYLLMGIFIILMPIIKYTFKIPYTQTIVALLLALLFDFFIVHLLEYQLFNVILRNSGLELDTAIKFTLDLFIALNNLFIAIIIYHKRPMFFPKTLFEEHVAVRSSLYNTQLVMVIFILAALNTGLLFSINELPFVRLEFQLFLMVWTAIICLSILFFLRKMTIYKDERKQFALDQQYQRDILSFYSLIRSQRHDFNLHLNAIYGLINNRDYASCKKYIEDMVKDAEYINELLPISHPAIGAMLNAFKELASQQDIKIHYYIYDDLRSMPCSVYEMNKIVGNLLQNSIDAVKLLLKNDSEIDMQISKEFESIVVTVSNATSIGEQELENIFTEGYSTKESHEGLGLPTIEKIIAKYNGIIFPELSGGRISFVVRIPVEAK